MPYASDRIGGHRRLQEVVQKVGISRLAKICLRRPGA
jgi:hypothetical protein